MVHFLHETREPLVDPLAYRTGAGVSARYNPNHRIHHHDFENVGEFDPDVSTGFLVRTYRWKMHLFGCVPYNERHAGADYERDARGDPKQPTPVQRRNPDQTEKCKSGEQCRPELENPESAKVDHKTEDAGKASAFGMTEPRGVDLHHTRRAECLQIPVNAADYDE